MPDLNLNAGDLRMFSALRIHPDLLARAQIVRVTNAQAREEYGIRGGGDMSGIAFPYFDPGSMSNGRRRYYARIRRDSPDFEDGKAVKKYVAPYGTRRHFYFPPTPELFADTNVPVCLVEAEKSSLALTAWSERTGYKVLALAIGGCWSWMGKVGIKETAAGERVPEHGVIPDLNICRDGRRTYVLLDADAATNPKVGQARSNLVRQLRRQRADVRVLDLPPGEGINGPDDFLGVRGDDAMRAVFSGAESGIEVLNAVEAFIPRFVVMSSAQVTAVALWCAHTWAFDVAIWTPYLAVTSAEKRCAKSRLLEAVSYIVRTPWATSSASSASLFRDIERKRPTLLLDEVDALFKGDKEFAQAVRAVLNAGAHYRGAVSRVVGAGTNMQSKDFSVFCPKALAGIGSLADTVADRSIPIRLKRKLPSEKVERLRESTVEAAAAPLRKRLKQWVKQQIPALKDAQPDIPDELNDRQQDGSECLLAIADAAGGPWPEKARAALIELYTGDAAQDQSLPTLLLADIRDIFERFPETGSFSSGTLIEELKKAEHGTWCEYYQGKSISSRSLSSLLGQFGIGPRAVRQRKEVFKGYRKEAFEDAWKRYLPLPPGENRLHRLQPAVYARETLFFHRLQGSVVTDARNEESPVFTRGVTDVTDKTLREGAGVDIELPCEVHGGHRNWWIEVTPEGGEMVCGKCRPEQDGKENP